MTALLLAVGMVMAAALAATEAPVPTPPSPARQAQLSNGLPTRFCVTDEALQVAESLDGVSDAPERTALYRRVLGSIRCVDALVPATLALDNNEFSALVLVASNITCQPFNASEVLSTVLSGSGSGEVYDAMLRVHPGFRGLAEAKLYQSSEESRCVDWDALIAELRRDRAAERALPILSVIATEQRLRQEARARVAAAEEARNSAAGRAAAAAEAAAQAKARQYAMLNAAGAAMDHSKVKADANANANANANAKAKGSSKEVAGTKSKATAAAQLELKAQAKAKAETKAAAAAEGKAKGKGKGKGKGRGRAQSRTTAMVVSAAQSGSQSAVSSAQASLNRAHVQQQSGAIASTTTKDGDMWWMTDEPWFLPPPDEWGPLPSTMYTHYWHKPRYNNDRYTSYNPLDSRPDNYNYQLPVAKRPRATLTKQLEYDDYVDKYIAHTHYNPSGDRNVESSTNMQYSNSAYFGNGGLNEGHARQLGKESPNNYAPLFSKSMDFYFHKNWNSPSFGGLYNGGINSFLQTHQTVRRHPTATSTATNTATTRFTSSPRVTYRPRSEGDRASSQRRLRGEH